MRGTEWEDDPVHREWGLTAYLGTRVTVGSRPYGTLWFGGTSPRNSGFSATERTFLDLLSQWAGYELERTEREERMDGLNGLSRELMDSESPAAVAECIVDAAAESLALPVTAIALYDDQTGDLEPVAATDAAAEALEATGLLEAGSGVGWNAFVGDAQCRVSDPRPDEGAADGTAVTELAVFPLSNYGVLVTGSTAADGLAAADVEFAQTVAANARAALDRVRRERELQAREETLEEQNETLERLDRVNDIIRSIDRALVQAASREEIERVVCEQLADAGPYEFAWIGEHDAFDGGVVPREQAGPGRGFLEGRTRSTGERAVGRAPTGRAIHTGEPQVVNDILDGGAAEQWRQDALNRGFHASIALPLEYEGTRYGVLTAYAGEPGVFDDLERSVLAELADTIAYAIDAAESRRALVSDAVTELTLTIHDPDLEFLGVAREAGCDLSTERIAARADGGIEVLFTTRGAPPEAIDRAAPGGPIDDVELLARREERGETVCLFEAALTERSLAATLAAQGARPHSIDVDEGTATITVELATEGTVREVVETITSEFPEAELIAQRTHERDRETVEEFRADLTDALTDRQLEVLKAAYFSGYFEEPRQRSGSEVAATLGIAQPTFTSHLRTAERKLCRRLFEGSEGA